MDSGWGEKERGGEKKKEKQKTHAINVCLWSKGKYICLNLPAD